MTPGEFMLRLANGAKVADLLDEYVKDYNWSKSPYAGDTGTGDTGEHWSEQYVD